MHKLQQGTAVEQEQEAVTWVQDVKVSSYKLYNTVLYMHHSGQSKMQQQICTDSGFS